MYQTTAEAFALATRHHAAGQLALAEPIYQALLAAEPNHAETLHRLGILAQQRGNPALAIDYLRRATACAGATAACSNNLGVACSALGDSRAAVTAFEQALHFRPDYPEAHNNLGVAWLQLGELELAAGFCEQAIRCRPAYPEAYDNLGTALRQQGRWQEAVAAHEQALRLNPGFATAANNLGIALQEQGHLEQALNWYQQALRLDPRHADASNNLATALKELGRLEEAVAQYRETLRLRPEHALATFNLSQFAAEGWYRFDAADLERIKARANGPGPAVERSLFCFTLAGELARAGLTDEAFATYRQANELRRGLLLERGQAFDAARHRAFVDRLIAAFDPAYFRRVAGWGSETELPVFIIGMPRSGSTLVEQILTSHPQVFGAGELGELPRLTARLAKAAGSADPQRTPLPLHNAGMSRELADAYLAHLTWLGGGAARVAVKTLENFLLLGVIATLFPRARIIHCRREPLDVGLSCYFQNFQNLDFTWSLPDIAAYHREHERLMAHWRRVLPLTIHEVRYEDLVRRQEAVSRELLAHCGLDWDDRCLAFFENRRAVRTASTLQVRKPMSTKSIGRWQRYRAHLGPLLSAFGEPGGIEALPPANTAAAARDGVPGVGVSGAAPPRPPDPARSPAPRTAELPPDGASAPG